jgi:DNA-binding response OmpR family regulator
LQRLGWTLCAGEGHCGHVLLIDARGLAAGEREAIAAAAGRAWRLLMLGVEQPDERAALLTLGCAEVLPSDAGLRELEARARRVDEMFGMLPRWRAVGPLTLDLFHRDARRGGRWLALHPREFGVLWRLADVPGKRVTKGQLLREVWRLNHEPETNSVEVHVSRLRSKLAEFGCGRLVATDPAGGYRLIDGPSSTLAAEAAEEDALDACLRCHRPWPVEAALEGG